MLRSKSSRDKTPLSAILEKELIAYGAAAQTNSNQNFWVATAVAALSVGAMALPELSNAEIVYTPTNQAIRPFSFLRIDLNNDGIADLGLNAYALFTNGSGYFENVSYLNASGLVGNQILLDNRRTDPRVRGLAAVDKIGQRIGPENEFRAAALMASCFSAGGPRGSTHRHAGWWIGAKERFLGVKFSIDNETHYGWVRITVPGCGGSGTVTGYAYETVPDRPIVAGAVDSQDTRALPLPGTDQDQMTTAGIHRATQAPVSLGLLAQGAPGIAVWRRKDRAVQ